jgi:hypothetical protein
MFQHIFSPFILLLMPMLLLLHNIPYPVNGPKDLFHLKQPAKAKRPRLFEGVLQK